jgi:hypothetical protein
MKFLILLFYTFLTSLAAAQNYYSAESGYVKFFSKAPLEDIEAKTNKVKAIINDSTGDIAVLIPIKSFIFKKALMQEHFNENYMESDKYKDASFKGKLLETMMLKAGDHKEVNVSGHLLMHGVPQQRVVTVLLKKGVDGSISATGKFSVRIAEHHIKVPSLLFQNIAEVVDITFDLTLKPVVHL